MCVIVFVKVKGHVGKQTEQVQGCPGKANRTSVSVEAPIGRVL